MSLAKAKKHELKEPEFPKDRRLRFSFQFYDESGKYCMSTWSKDQIKKSFNRLKGINTKKCSELIVGGRVYRFGEVVWEKTIEKKGFPDNNVNKLPPYHFSLIGVNGQLARVFGALYQDTFYIVWFDLNHKIWPVPLKNT